MVDVLKEELPDTYILNCEVGSGSESTLLMTIEDQIKELDICINNDPHMEKGFVGVGYSNGGMIMRGYLEKYNHIHFPMKRFVGLSAPLGGFFCGIDSDCNGVDLPDIIIKATVDLIYSDFIQATIGPTNYWRDPFNLDKYEAECETLPELDNLRETENSAVYKKNFQSVDKFILFGSDKDGAITPWQSAWFGVWKEGTDSDVVLMEDRPEYVQDLFGLRSMNEAGRIQLINSNIDHFQYYSNDSFIRSLAPYIDVDV